MVMEMHSNKLLEILYYVVWMDSSLKEGVDFIQDSVQFQVRRHVPLEYKYVMCRMYKCVCSVQRHSHQGCLSSSNTRARGVALRHDNHRLACWQSGGVDRRSGCCDCGGLLVGNGLFAQDWIQARKNDWTNAVGEIEPCGLDSVYPEQFSPTTAYAGLRAQHAPLYWFVKFSCRSFSFSSQIM
eukprot:scpid89255/ scgid1090/ 